MIATRFCAQYLPILEKFPEPVVRFEESGTGVEYQVFADINTAIFAEGGIKSEEASVTVNWWPLHDQDDRSWYNFHYYDSSGFDCGWHRHENEHIDGITPIRNANLLTTNMNTMCLRQPSEIRWGCCGRSSPSGYQVDSK